MKTKIYLSIFAVTTCMVTSWQSLSPSHAQSFVGGRSRSGGVSITVNGRGPFPNRGYAATRAETTTYSSTPDGGGLSGSANTTGTANTGVGSANYSAGADATLTGTGGTSIGVTGASATGNSTVTPSFSSSGFVSVGGYSGYSRP
jgi:hypothetical protein